ncbi:hypothetical protein OROHE_001795 [Orobanche hederae]
MEGYPNTELANFLQNQMKSLKRRVHELETENAKLSVQISRCVCQKITTNDKASVLECTHSIGEMEGQIYVNDAREIINEKVPDKSRDKVALLHFPKRHIALKVMYFGQRFYGFASDAQMDPTVESEIFKALKRTRLISGDKKELEYSRCGRTDKGVSSVGQWLQQTEPSRAWVLTSNACYYSTELELERAAKFELELDFERVISLFLRSNLKKTEGINGYSGEFFAEESCGREIDYVKILNQVLPKDIRVIGWSPAPTNFSARFSCLSREYKYFFWRENLNINAMEISGKKFIGEHDFRNFCKMDAANVHNYRRRITSFEIFPCNERFEDDDLWAVKIEGSAFLWHQIRCMVAVLFLIGQGLEPHNVIDELLDIERTPRKPQYTMASEIPLVLRSCEFEGLKFKCSSDAARAVCTHLKKECRSFKLQAAIFHEAVLSSSCSFYGFLTAENVEQNSRTKKKESAHIPLMSRETEPTYEERRAKLDAGVARKKVPVLGI